MIQRKQTLFLIQSIFLSSALLFIPSLSVTSNQALFEVSLVPLQNGELRSSIGHLAAIGINFLILTVSILNIFLYKRRNFQLQLCYVLLMLWAILALMQLFCPMLQQSEHITLIQINYFAPIIACVGIVASYFAARFIKKDIELLKSADRIR